LFFLLCVFALLSTIYGGQRKDFSFAAVFALAQFVVEFIKF